MSVEIRLVVALRGQNGFDTSAGPECCSSIPGETRCEPGLLFRFGQTRPYAREEEPLKPSRLCYFSPVQCLLHFSKEKIAETVKNDEFGRHGMEKRASASAAIFHIKHAHKHRIRRARQRAQAASMLTMQLGMQWTFDT
ncbi:unnamed protein product [Toxocara canis]|uniref:Uncharacterized protein n=1 Tax=Toxocara canis TaxID=6265 RepID=A0A183UH23_TOXCA|nr:unnamed protein product [Toxocara canis]